MTGWTWLWLAWLGAFVAIEGRALANKTPGDTLSEHVWKWFATRREDLRRPDGKKASAWVKIRRTVLVAFLAWLALHFTTGGEYV